MKITAANKKELTDQALGIFIKVVKTKYKSSEYNSVEKLSAIISKDFGCKCTPERIRDFNKKLYIPEVEEAALLYGPIFNFNNYEEIEHSC